MRKRLGNFRKLIKESEHLANMLARPAESKEYLTDTVKDYRSGYPHNILISGIGDDKYPRIQQEYYEKLRRIQSEIAAIEKWLDSVPDPEVRDILRLQYVNGLTQEQIADELGYSRSAIAMKIQRFWENYGNEQKNA